MDLDFIRGVGVSVFPFRGSPGGPAGAVVWWSGAVGSGGIQGCPVVFSVLRPASDVQCLLHSVHRRRPM